MFESLKDFKRYCRTAKPINFGVYYSSRLNRIVLGERGRVINVCGKKGIFFTKGGYLGSSFVKIGELI